LLIAIFCPGRIVGSPITVKRNPATLSPATGVGKFMASSSGNSLTNGWNAARFVARSSFAAATSS
jgi:hypothetical protein